MNSSAKGSTFEREIATTLSLWYTKGASDRVFWRSASSGAMATVRTKKGKTTAGGYGDITAIDPIGAPLTDTCVLELKKGYNSGFDPLWIVDRPDKNKPTVLESILLKLQQEAKDAGRPHHMLIFKRDRRETMIAVPATFLNSYWYYDTEYKGNSHHFLSDLHPKLSIYTTALAVEYHFYRLDTFLTHLDPGYFEYFWTALRKHRAATQAQATGV